MAKEKNWRGIQFGGADWVSTTCHNPGSITSTGRKKKGEKNERKKERRKVVFWRISKGWTLPEDWPWTVSEESCTDFWKTKRRPERYRSCLNGHLVASRIYHSKLDLGTTEFEGQSMKKWCMKLYKNSKQCLQRAIPGRSHNMQHSLLGPSLGITCCLQQSVVAPKTKGPSPPVPARDTFS